MTTIATEATQVPEPTAADLLAEQIDDLALKAHIRGDASARDAYDQCAEMVRISGALNDVEQLSVELFETQLDVEEARYDLGKIAWTIADAITELKRDRPDIRAVIADLTDALGDPGDENSEEDE